MVLILHFNVIEPYVLVVNVSKWFLISFFSLLLQSSCRCISHHLDLYDWFFHPHLGNWFEFVLAWGLKRDNCIVYSLKEPICVQTYLYNTDRTKTLFDGLFCHRGMKIGHKHLICLIFFSCKIKRWIKSIMWKLIPLLQIDLQKEKYPQVLRDSFDILQDVWQ